MRPKGNKSKNLNIHYNHSCSNWSLNEKNQILPDILLGPDIGETDLTKILKRFISKLEVMNYWFKYLLWVLWEQEFEVATKDLFGDSQSMFVIDGTD
jgi:hypothetical protein